MFYCIIDTMSTLPPSTIVMIGPFAFQPKGTVSARAFIIARALARRGHTVTILMPPYDHPADSGRCWAQDGVRLENMRLSGDGLRARIRVPLQMARRAAALDPDAVHVFKPTGYSGLAGLYLSLFSRCPLVVDTDDWEGSGGWADVNGYSTARRHFVDWQERWLPRHAGAVTVASRVLEAQVHTFGVDPERVIYLPNGPDERLRDVAPAGRADRAALRRAVGAGCGPLALYLGHVPHGNDLDLAIDALARVRAGMPEAQLAILGPGAGVEALRHHAQVAGVGDAVYFYPEWIEPEQAHRWVAAADLVVAPYRDTLINRARCPAKVVTAMALGQAVVTSRVGENVEYVEHGRSGLLAAPGDVEGLARALATLLSEPALAAELGQNAHRRIWDHFGWQVRIGEVERAYHLAIGRRTR
ncbi:MAG: glycosyltransferase family 4 protein [Anaerolineae bacterium]|nr:glycosyltransferase family 4 protein [Anaerolineae bacterium]